jgi:hypothetical protein
LVNASFVSLAVPEEHNAKEFIMDGSPFDPCSAYQPISPKGVGALKNFDTSNATMCNHFVFD